ncbi:hypothetical protein HBI83_081190 [Parastagonospora nodorum]|nr:hypothetical protein HBI84_076070 [Parastagonospora nodorum]KAH6023192.1 hypothetical protein HBI83_081190 [Parastagonospora nodorum]KAH6471179.1 hypothetical protein HBI59_031820 [Parastagonospora nodorum]
MLKLYFTFLLSAFHSTPASNQLIKCARTSQPTTTAAPPRSSPPQNAPNTPPPIPVTSNPVPAKKTSKSGSHVEHDIRVPAREHSDVDVTKVICKSSAVVEVMAVARCWRYAAA